MATPPLSDELAWEAAEAFRKTGNKSAAADLLGISRGAYNNRLATAARRGMVGTDPVIPGFVITRVSTTHDDADNIIRKHVRQTPEIEHGPFNLPEGHLIKGVSALLDAEGNVQQQWVKTREGEIDPLWLAERIKEAFADWTPPAFPVIAVPETDDNLLTIYPIADLHLGLRAVADESGADFDLRTATERFRETSARLFDRSPNSNTALILQLGDFFHVDDDLAATPASKNTLQVSDRLLDIARSGVRLLVDYVYHALTKHERVVVKCIKGNHDLNAWISLYVGLSEHFRDNPRVTVDGGAADYWFFRWGATLIGAHHGHRLKPQEMAGAMAMECREDWGETLYRLFLHGHLHHLIVKEVLGVRVECFRTLAEVDQHHSGKYGSGKSLTSITIHKTDGEEGRAQINLPPVRKRAEIAIGH